MKKLALLSAYDKAGIATCATSLVERGYDLLSTGGTEKLLREQNIPVLSVSDYTQQQEIMDGRVKTLHPMIHAGILARRNNPGDRAALEELKARPIDFVVVNLYPFIEQLAQVESAGDAAHDSLVEFIDIGGPTMIRAAAKNCQFVVPLTDPADYELVFHELDTEGDVSQATRRELAAKVFALMASYDLAVARYFALGERVVVEETGVPVLAPVGGQVLQQVQALRYGENPHQAAALYASVGDKRLPWELLQGKELSYNNLLDADAAANLLLDVAPGTGAAAAVVIKHSNPCGAAVRENLLEAFVAARACDPLSAFGGIIALDSVVDGGLAASILEGFVEVVLATDFTDEARAAFAKKKNVRLLRCEYETIRALQSPRGGLARRALGYVLVQEADAACAPRESWRTVTERGLDDRERADADFAWRVCKHVKSNAIVIVNGQQAIGVGAGQMSRVDAAELAIRRALHHNHSLEGSVAASDAFLPFSDTLERLAEAGVRALVQPGGSIRDEDVIAAANERGMAMVCTGERHFRH